MRHLGPTAEDFRAAFGLGDSDAAIATVDIDGVNLLAVQALERRTAELTARFQTTSAELEVLKAQAASIEALRARVAELERLLSDRQGVRPR